MPVLNGQTLLSRARRHADDTVEPYFISDVEMYQYLSEAERALAVAGKLLRDVEEYSVALNQRWVRLPATPEIIEFKDAVLADASGNRWPLKTRGTMDVPSSVADYKDDDYGLVSSTEKLTPGRPRTLIFGKRTGYIELSPVSNGAYTIEASIIIYPKFELELATDEPSIAERHHGAIPIGAALFALEGSEHEHLRDKISSLDTAWQRALFRAAEEDARTSRDAGVVQFNNIFW